jgi:hypothetical protein
VRNGEAETLAKLPPPRNDCRSAYHSYTNRIHSRFVRFPFLLTGERNGPEFVSVPAPGRTLGVEGHLARGQHAPLDRVHLRDDLALARQGHAPVLQQDLEIRRPPLLRFVREVLAHHLREGAPEVLHQPTTKKAPRLGLSLPQSTTMVRMCPIVVNGN